MDRAGLVNNPLIPVVQQPAAANHRPHNITMIRVILGYMGSIAMARFIEGRDFNDYKAFVTEIEDLEKETFCKFIKKKPKL